MDRVFLGTEVRAAGLLTRHQLSSRCVRVFPDVYALKDQRLGLADRITAAWLWPRRRAVVGGLAAAALLGSRWVDEDITIELNHVNNKAPPGIIARNQTLRAGEVFRMRGIAVTTAARTAFDLGRHGPAGTAVARLDALMNATHITREEIAEVAACHPNVRGVRRLGAVLERVDAGAQSPRETWLRLLLVDAGFPRPQTQIPVLGPDGRPRYFLDTGWPEIKVAAEYDGDHHRTDRTQFNGDILRAEYISGQGWIVVRVVAGTSRREIVARVRRAWALAGASIQTSDRGSRGNDRHSV